MSDIEFDYGYSRNPRKRFEDAQRERDKHSYDKGYSFTQGADLRKIAGILSRPQGDTNAVGVAKFQIRELRKAGLKIPNVTQRFYKLRGRDLIRAYRAFKQAVLQDPEIRDAMQDSQLERDAHEGIQEKGERQDNLF